MLSWNADWNFLSDMPCQISMYLITLKQKLIVGKVFTNFIKYRG